MNIIIIENPCYLSIKNSQLLVDVKNGKSKMVHIPDYQCIVIDSQEVTLSMSVIRAMGENSVPLIINNEQHYPNSICLPYNGIQQNLIRLKKQIELEKFPEIKNKVWELLCKAKIKASAKNLEFFKINGSLNLNRMVEKVLGSDTSNIEAQAAKFYWSNLFNSFSREKQDAFENRNIALNYLYAILRSSIATTLVASGLILNLGIHHCSTLNPMNLADDFIEPLRCWAEWAIKINEGYIINTGLTTENKKKLLSFLLQEWKINNQSYTFLAALRKYVYSYIKYLENMSNPIWLEIPEINYDKLCYVN